MVGGQWPVLDYDDSEYPLVRMTITGVRTPKDNVAYMRRIEMLLDAGDRFVVVVDDQSTECRPARRQRWRGRWWVAGRRRLFRRTCVAMAIVTSEADLARVERTTRRLQHMSPVPTSLFCDVAMADAWVHSRLASEDGRSVPGRRLLPAVRRMFGWVRVRRTRQAVEPI